MGKSSALGMDQAKQNTFSEYDLEREYLILPTYSSLQSVAYTQVAYRRLPIDSSLLLSLEIFWPIPSMPEARL